MAVNLAALTTGFLVSFLVLPVIIKYSLKKNLVDVPGRRKIHKKVTPSLGGIAIFIGFFISVLFWVDFENWKDLKFLLIPLFIIFFIGVRDDLVPLRAYMKLIGQIVAACFLVFFFDIKLSGLYGILSVHQVPAILSYTLTVVTIIVITNSFNLIDGLDGLAGTISGIAFLSFGIWFYLNGETIYSLLAFAMVGAIIAFLIFNWDPSEIFMGDTGALVIGMTLAVMAIHFINVNFSLSEFSPYKFKASVATGACFIIIPLIDTARIIILRISKKKSPLKPDKSHVHHAILRLGMSHGQSTMLLGGVHLSYIVFAVLFHDISENWVLLGLLIYSITLSVFLDRLILQKKTIKSI